MYSIYGLQFTSEGADRYCAKNCNETIRIAVMDRFCDAYEAHLEILNASEQKFIKVNHTDGYTYTFNVLNGGDILIAQFDKDEVMLAFAFAENKGGQF